VRLRPRVSHYLRRLGLCIGVVALVGAVSALLERSLNSYISGVMVFMAVNVILAVSLNLVNGDAGLFSIGHAGFMAIGAYTAAWFSVTYGRPWLESACGGSPTPLVTSIYLLGVMLVGGLAAAVGGLLAGLPALRLRGDYLAIATLGFGEIIRVVLLNVDAVGGARGLAGIPRYSSLFLCLVVAVLTATALRNLNRSAHGRAIMAVREDETSAEALGIDCARYKALAFVVGAFFAGMAGCLYAHYLQFIHPRGFDFMKSIELVLMVVLGGGRISGVIVAAIAVTLLPEGLRQVKDTLHLETDPRMVLYSGLLIATMLVRARRFGPRRRGGGRRAR